MAGLSIVNPNAFKDCKLEHLFSINKEEMDKIKELFPPSHGKIIMQKKYVIKTGESIRKEAIILDSAYGKNKHIIELYGIFEKGGNLYMVMERGYCDLYYYIFSSLYKKEQIKDILLQILSALIFFHLNGMGLMDLKLENIVVGSNRDQLTIKIIDFEAVKKVSSNNMSATVTGNYISPEIMLGQTTGQNVLTHDMWTLGVILYILMYSSFPFPKKNENDYSIPNVFIKGMRPFMDIIKKSKIPQPPSLPLLRYSHEKDSPYISVSSKFRDEYHTLLHGLFSLWPEHRLNAKDALELAKLLPKNINKYE
jgi:serine/threonine protein kinase